MAWGTLTILWPPLLFDRAGAERLNYPEIWQCVGMIVGVYGIGYLIAASDTRTHWPIVLVGLLGKIFGPIGFVGAVLGGTFPPLFGLTILTNDLLWWIPFSPILKDAWIYRTAGRLPGSASPLRFVKQTRINALLEVVFRFHESPNACFDASWSACSRKDPKQNLVCIDLQPYQTVQACEPANIMKISGFSNALAAFVQMDSDPNRFAFFRR